MKNLLSKIFIIIFMFSFFLPAYCEEKESINDYLYSAEYFDYLIECAEIEKEKEEQLKKEQELKQEEAIISDLITPNYEEDIIFDDFEPFKLRIEANSDIKPYSESFIKENSKTIIPVGDKFGFVQDMLKTRNKYSSHDYKILAGVELKPIKFLNIGGGLETNYRGIDQNPSSRKLYFTPSISITDKLSLSFPNKINTSTHSTDHDIGLKVSPFKSKFMDFGVYAGVTKYKTGRQTESINFSTNLYLF